MNKPADYVFKTEPYDHQLEDFLITRNDRVAAIHWEPGLGKTKLIIDTAAHLWSKGEIDALFIIAPNRVHTNWIRRELPVHMPDYVPYKCIAWDGNYRTMKFEKAFKAVQNFKGLAVFAVNVEAFQSDGILPWVDKFLSSRNTLGALDESTRIKTPTAKRTKSILKLRKKLAYRRVMTGTAVTNSPFDLYCPFAFLDPEIIGFASYFRFTHYYGIWKKEKNWGTNQDYETLQQYMNLDQLKADIAPYTVERDKSCLGLPEKIERMFMVEPTTEQQKLYAEVAKSIFIEFEEQEITTQIALVKGIRLQQINGGFLPNQEEPGEWLPLKKGNPKMEALQELIQELPPDAHVIIWARFVPELKMAHDLIEKMYPGSSALFIGETPGEEREKIIDRFNDLSDKLRFFIGSPGAGGIGITLNAAGYVFRLSNSYSLEERIQSDDRSHRIGQNKSVVYTDIVMAGTIDEAVSESLHNKRDISEMMKLKNGLRKLITPDWEKEF